jgi:hypothetical protein
MKGCELHYKRAVMCRYSMRLLCCGAAHVDVRLQTIQALKERSIVVCVEHMLQCQAVHAQQTATLVCRNLVFQCA